VELSGCGSRAASPSNSFMPCGASCMSLSPLSRYCPSAWPFAVRYWLVGFRFSIRCAIVERHGDVPKTENSAETMMLSEELLSHLQLWRQLTQFPAEQDWLFASPIKIGCLAVFLHRSMAGITKGGKKRPGSEDSARIASAHTYRSWLDQVGTRLAVLQKAMRHCDIRTTMIHDDVVDRRTGPAL